MPIFQLLKDKYTPETLPYHVIVPSLPGYTLSSGPPTSKDFGYQDAARVLDRLMSTLGFGDGYVAQGGDVGSGVARVMGATSPGCKGSLFTPSALRLHKASTDIVCDLYSCPRYVIKISIQHLSRQAR